MDNVNLMVLGCQASQAHPYCARNTPASVSVGLMGVFGAGVSQSGILLRVVEGAILSMIAVQEFAPLDPNHVWKPLGRALKSRP